MAIDKFTADGRIDEGMPRPWSNSLYNIFRDIRVRFQQASSDIASNTPFDPNAYPPYSGWMIEAWGGTNSAPSGAAAPSLLGTAALQEPTSKPTHVWDLYWRSRSTSGSAGQAAGWSSPRALGLYVFWRGDAAHMGGFKLYVQFAITTALPSTAKTLFAVTDKATNTVTVDPSTTNDAYFGIGTDAGDANFQVIRGTKSGSNFTKVDTGIAKTGVGIYTVAIYCVPNDTVMKVKFMYWADSGVTVTTGTGANDTSYSDKLPVNTAGLKWDTQVQAAGSSLTLDFLYNRITLPYTAVLTNTF